MLSKLILYGKGLSLRDIEALSEISDEYILPHDRTLAKPYGLVFYTTENRPGAIEEAQTMMKAFVSSGFTAYAYSWKQFSELNLSLANKLDEIGSDCCFLIVSIMAHGFKGHLIDSDGMHGQINDLIKEAELRLQDFIPVVS